MSEKKKSEKLTIRIEKELKDKLERIAKEEDLSMGQVVRKAVKEYLKKIRK